MMMLLNVAQATILADSRLIQVKADKLNWVPQSRIAVYNRKQTNHEFR